MKLTQKLVSETDRNIEIVAKDIINAKSDAEQFILTGFQRYYDRPWSTGHVFVTPVSRESEMSLKYYPGVFGLEIIFVDENGEEQTP